CIHAGGTRLLRCSPGYACIAEHRQRGASTPLVLTLFRKRWSSAFACLNRQGQAVGTESIPLKKISICPMAGRR
ncbi:MAG: hypothetical protein V3T83_11545, partial [Acidobacteriota bacterium]